MMADPSILDLTDNEVLSLLRRLKKQNKKIKRFTIRREANVLTYHSFRNTHLESIHNLISDDEMKWVNIESSARLENLLRAKLFVKINPLKIIEECFLPSLKNVENEIPKRDIEIIINESAQKLKLYQEIKLKKPVLYKAFVEVNTLSTDYWDEKIKWNGKELNCKK